MAEASPPRYRAVLIDLDGTLVDTVTEIAAASNAVLAEAGRPPVSEGDVAAAVGEGASTLLVRLMGPVEAERWLPRYMEHYRRTNGSSSVIYPGALDGLNAMRDAGLAIACVTNKPRELVGPLFEWLGIRDRFDCFVGGGDTALKKPHPDPLLLACQRMSVAPGDCVMVGDSINDARAAAAAGMVSLTVPYGYPGFGGEADRAEALLARGLTQAVVPDLVAAAAWIGCRATDRAG